MAFRALSDNIVCSDGDFGGQVTAGGIILNSSLGKGEGIVPRWFKVRYVGDDIDWLTPGEWVLVEYGRWTEGFNLEGERMWKVDPNGCLATSPEKPDTLNLTASTVHAEKKELY